MPAVSKAQQKFMGMVHAAQKGEEPASPEVAKAAKEIDPKDAKDFASTKHKGLPMKKETITRARLKELVREVMKEESEYQAYFKKELEKAGKSITQMSDEEKKAFFDKIDTAWNGKGEKNEELTGGQHKLDVDKDGDIGADDLADLRTSKNELTFKTGAAARAYRAKHKLRPGTKISIKGIPMPNGQKKVDEVGELPNATIPSSVKSKLMMAIDKIKDTKLTYNQKIQVVGQVMDSLGIDKSEFNKMSSKLKGTMESTIKEESPCWKGYKQVGMKDKNGKQVPNCVPV